MLSHLLLFVKSSCLNRNTHKRECRMRAKHFPTQISQRVQVVHTDSPCWSKESCLFWKLCFIHRYTFVNNRQWTFFVCEIWPHLSSLAYTLISLIIPCHIQLTFNLCLCVVSGEKPAQEEKTGILCQHPNCPERRLASKVRYQNVSHGIGKPWRGDANG